MIENESAKFENPPIRSRQLLGVAQPPRRRLVVLGDRAVIRPSWRVSRESVEVAGAGRGRPRGPP